MLGHWTLQGPLWSRGSSLMCSSGRETHIQPSAVRERERGVHRDQVRPLNPRGSFYPWLKGHRCPNTQLVSDVLGKVWERSLCEGLSVTEEEDTQILKWFRLESRGIDFNTNTTTKNMGVSEGAKALTGSTITEAENIPSHRNQLDKQVELWLNEDNICWNCVKSDIFAYWNHKSV